MQEYSYELKISKERVAVLIGTRGKTKRQVEKATKTVMRIDSREGDVFLHGSDALGIYTAREVINAIGRGFNPDIALLLLKADYTYEQFNLNDFAKTKKMLLRVKGRVIGADGKARRIIEELSECYLSVYGKTIAVIGLVEHTPLARHAIESLLAGSPHANVYAWLEKQRKRLKERQLMERAA